MEIFDFKDKDLLPIGDLHGEFRTLKHLLKQNASLQKHSNGKRKKRQLAYIQNTVIIVCGDVSLGFNKPEYYQQQLKGINDLLEADNNILLFVRGNHDNPDWFVKGNEQFLFSNIICVPDYSVLITKYYTTLCIGGGISVDRSWRIKDDALKNRFKGDYKRFSYWDKERIQPNNNIALELKENGILLNSILTHTFPIALIKDSLKKEYKTSIATWCDVDETLEDDISQESDLLEKIINTLCDEGHTISKIWHGHFHMQSYNTFESNNGTKIEEISLPMITSMHSFNNVEQPCIEEEMQAPIFGNAMFEFNWEELRPTNGGLIEF